MVELEFAKKSEESAQVRRPQPSYYTQALQQKIRHLYGVCKEKDDEIARLNGGVVKETRSPYEDIRYPASGINGDDKKLEEVKVDNGGTNGETNGAVEGSIKEEEVSETPERALSPSNVCVKMEGTDTAIVEQPEVPSYEDVVSEASFLTPSIEEEIQNYILSLVDKISGYNSTAAQIISSTDTKMVRSKLEQIDSAGVDKELIELRSCVESKLESLAASTALIQDCANPAALQSVVEARDENLLAVSQAVEKYVGQIEGTDLQNKYEVISEIVASFQRSSDKTDSDQSLTIGQYLKIKTGAYDRFRFH